MSMLLILLAAATEPARGAATAEAAMSASRDLTGIGCRDERRADAITICGRRDADRRFRLPYPSQRERSDLRLPGEIRPIDAAAEASICRTVAGMGCARGLINVIALVGQAISLGTHLVEDTEPLAPPIPVPED